VAAVFLPMVRAWQQMASGYSDDELRLIVDFPQTDGKGTPRPPHQAARHPGRQV